MTLKDLCTKYDITFINKSNFNGFGNFNDHLHESHKIWLVNFMIKHGYDKVTYYVNSQPYFDLNGYCCSVEDFYEDDVLENYIKFVDLVIKYFSSSFVVVFVDGEIKLGNFTHLTIKIEKTGEIILINSKTMTEKRIIFNSSINPADTINMI